MEAQPKTTTVTVFYTDAAPAMPLIGEDVLGITKLRLFTMIPLFNDVARDNITIRSSALVVLLTTNTLDDPHCELVIKLALEKKIKIILVHDVASPFPQPSKIVSLSPEVQEVFKSIAVPLIDMYSKHCWKKICDKIEQPKQPTAKNWFLSHRQKTGQGIALALFHELKALGDTAFLDIKTEFDLHDLEKCVDLCDYFVLILTEGIFDSEYCFKELSHAVATWKPIVVIRDINFSLPLDDNNNVAIPSSPYNWSKFSSLINGSRTILYSGCYLEECAQLLHSVKTDPTSPSSVVKFYSYSDYLPKLPSKGDNIVAQNESGSYGEYLEWVSVTPNSGIPPNAIIGATHDNGGNVYIARGHVGTGKTEHISVGKALWQDECLVAYVPYHGENRVNYFEVLCSKTAVNSSAQSAHPQLCWRKPSNGAPNGAINASMHADGVTPIYVIRGSVPKPHPHVTVGKAHMKDGRLVAWVPNHGEQCIPDFEVLCYN